MRWALLFFLALASCTGRFDSGIYTKMVDAATTLTTEDCSDAKKLADDVVRFKAQIRWITVFETGIPYDGDTVTALNGIMDEADRFQNMINHGTVSPLYCQNKINNIQHGMLMLIRAEGKKQ